MAAMNVIYASTWDCQCGVAEYSHSLVLELEKHERVEVVSLDPGSISSPARLAARLNQGDVAHIQHQYPFFGGMAFYRNWFRQALTKIEVPLVVTVHELDLGDSDPLPIRMYKRYFNRMLFSPPEIYRFIVHSEDYREQMTGIGIDPRDISVIPEGVPKVTRSRISMVNAKSLLNISGKRVITIFGFVVKRKGYEIALEAMKSLPDDVVLMIAGGAHPDDKTGFFNDLKDEIESSRISNRVVVTGYLPNHEIPVIMAATDLVVAPFTSISNSGSILRAIAYRKPILTADLPWSRELSDKCKGLSLFHAGNASDFAVRVNEMLTGKKLLTGAASGSKDYAESWTVARAAEQTVDIYRDILKQ